MQALLYTAASNLQIHPHTSIVEHDCMVMRCMITEGYGGKGHCNKLDRRPQRSRKVMAMLVGHLHKDRINGTKLLLAVRQKCWHEVIAANPKFLTK